MKNNARYLIRTENVKNFKEIIKEGFENNISITSEKEVSDEKTMVIFSFTNIAVLSDLINTCGLQGITLSIREIKAQQFADLKHNQNSYAWNVAYESYLAALTTEQK